MPTDPYVNAETPEGRLRAALAALHPSAHYVRVEAIDLRAILVAIRPDPRLDALLAAAREVERTWGIEGMAKAADALRDALAAFDGKPEDWRDVNEVGIDLDAKTARMRLGDEKAEVDIKGYVYEDEGLGGT